MVKTRSSIGKKQTSPTEPKSGMSVGTVRRSKRIANLKQKSAEVEPSSGKTAITTRRSERIAKHARGSVVEPSSGRTAIVEKRKSERVTKQKIPIDTPVVASNKEYGEMRQEKKTESIRNDESEKHVTPEPFNPFYPSSELLRSDEYWAQL